MVLLRASTITVLGIFFSPKMCAGPADFLLTEMVVLGLLRNTVPGVCWWRDQHLWESRWPLSGSSWSLRVCTEPSEPTCTFCLEEWTHRARRHPLLHLPTGHCTESHRFLQLLCLDPTHIHPGGAHRSFRLELFFVLALGVYMEGEWQW